MPPRRVQTSPSPISAAPTPVPLSRRDPPPHQPSRGRQASPRWYNIPPPQWYVLSTPLTGGSKIIAPTFHCLPTSVPDNGCCANQMRYQYGSVDLVKSPLASANSEKGKALRRVCSDSKQASNRLLGRGDSGIDDMRPSAPCDRKSHRNRRVVDQPVLKLRR